jgi:hypothetical protein
MELILGGGMLFLMFFFCVASALFASAVADSKGRSGMLWFVLGFFFNIFALIAVAGMPSLLGQPSTRTHFQCPECMEYIHKEARKCRCCGARLAHLSDEEKGIVKGPMDWLLNN